MGSLKNSSSEKLSILFWLGLLYALSVPLIIMNWKDDYKLVLISSIPGILCVLFSIKGLLKKIKIFGLEAELNAIREDTYAKLEAMQELAVVAASTSLETLAFTGGYGMGITFPRKLELMQNYQNLLGQVGCSIEQTKKAIAPFNLYLRWAYQNKIVNLARDTIKEGKLKEEFMKEISSKTDRLGLPPKEVLLPDELMEMIRKHSASQSTVAELMDDYSLFIKSGEVRRPHLLIP